MLENKKISLHITHSLNGNRKKIKRKLPYNNLTNTQKVISNQINQTTKIVCQSIQMIKRK